MKETLTLTIKLLLICAIVTGLLATVNMITTPIIAENTKANEELAMTEVLPDAGTFTELTLTGFSPEESGVTLDSVFQSKSGGYVVTTTSSEGYGGDITVMTGIFPDGIVNRVKIMSMAETPGLGAKAKDAKFINQYRGLSNGVSVVKNAIPEGNQIAAISGATKTSDAVTKAVNTALSAVAYAGQGGK